jgi:hypothetical protein
VALTAAPCRLFLSTIIEHALKTVCALLGLPDIPMHCSNPFRLEQLVVVFKKKLSERADLEESWHVFRHIMEDMTAMVRSQPTEYPPFFAGMAMKVPAGASN